MGSKAIKSLIRCAALGAVFALIYSCTQEPFSEKHTGTTETDGTVRVGLYTDAGDYQVPVSRASAYEGMDVTSMPWVFVFIGNDDNAKFAEVKQAFKFGDISCVMLKPQISKAVRVLIVANPPETFFNGTSEVAFTADNLNAALTSGTTTFGTAVNTILNTARLTDPVNTVPYVPQLYIPMTGIYDIAEGIDLSTTIGKSGEEIRLYRPAAKVTVENSAANFLLSSASVAGANSYGRLYQTTPMTSMTGNSIINYAEGIAPAIGAVASGSTSESPIYIYESASGQTSVIVKGSYKNTPYYYKLAFKDPATGSLMAVERNKWYEFTITSVSGAGCLSFDDAAAGSPSNVITASIKVIDQNSYDMTDNGLYYVGLSNSALEIVSDKGTNDEFIAVTVTTDATLTSLKGANSIYISSGTGLLSCSPAKLTLGSGTTPGITEIKIKTKASAATELGRITIKLGNITKEIIVRNSTGSNAAAPPANVVEATGLFTSASVDPASSSWLSFVVGNKNYTDFTNPDNSSINFKLKTEPNYGSTNTRRVGTAYITNANGRTKYYVIQNALDPATITTTLISNSYVGTFHKWDQIGERVIRMPNTGGSNWSATVLAGNFIILDTETLGRTNTNDNTALTGNSDPETYKIIGSATNVVGSDDYIYFRVGMTDKLPNGSATAAPRYGRILVTYNNNTMYHIIYVRQGEAADYLMRNIAEDNPKSGPMQNIQRTLANKISPYNLTDPNGGTGRVGAVTGYKYDFTTYPSKGGYFFQWYQTWAWSPVGATATNWLYSNSSTDLWEPNKALWETCPAGYHRPNDGSTSEYVDVNNAPANSSELRQSLFLNPQNGTGSSSDNSLWGYLADGFFDRMSIVSNTTAGSGADVAYIGMLFYNKNNNASVFFPASGLRNAAGELSSTGVQGYYSSSTSHNLTTHALIMNFANNYAYSPTINRYAGFSVRCVADPLR